MSKNAKIVVGAMIAILGLIVAAFLWWSLRGEGPPAVDLETAVALIESDSDADESAIPTTASVTPTISTPTVGDASSTATSTSTTPPTSTATNDAASTATSTSTTPPASTATEDGRSTGTDSLTTVAAAPVNAETAGLAGVWTLSTGESSDDLSEEAAVSFAGYRVVEVLAGGVDESTVVGRTTGVAGSIELRGAALVAATVEVEMATLRTDDSHRDSHAREALNTNRFPLAVFTLVEPVELPPDVFEGESFSGPAVGDLTIKGVTNRREFVLEAQLVGDTIVVIGSTDVVFSDYGVTAPTSRAVISVEDHGIMELQLFFTR